VVIRPSKHPFVPVLFFDSQWLQAAVGERHPLPEEQSLPLDMQTAALREVEQAYSNRKVHHLELEQARSNQTDFRQRAQARTQREIHLQVQAVVPRSQSPSTVQELASNQRAKHRVRELAHYRTTLLLQELERVDRIILLMGLVMATQRDQPRAQAVVPQSQIQYLGLERASNQRAKHRVRELAHYRTTLLLQGLERVDRIIL
jgi:VanZ family protein